MKHNCVKKIICLIFSRLGYNIGRFPQFYVAIPVILSIILGSGIIKVTLVKDFEYLFLPSNARSRDERNAIESLFPTNKSKSDYGRLVTLGSYVVILALPKNTISILNEDVIEDLIKMDSIVKNLSFVKNSSFMRYKDLCSKTNQGKCLDQLSLILKMKNLLNSDKCIVKYPFDASLDDPIIPAFSIGGAELDEENCIKEIKSFRFVYILDGSNGEKKNDVFKWEEIFLREIENVNFKSITVYSYLSRSIDDNLGNILQSGSFLMLYISPIVLIFVTISCMTSDGVRSKPWLGIASALSPLLSTMSAFGLLVYCKAEFLHLNLLVFFLLLGIGMDDSFIMIAAWRRTNINNSVPKRMSQAYSEAAVSITLTSFTNLIAFCMALFTPYRFVQILCLYASLSILFDYFYQLFFFGGIMALDGYREKHNFHSILCWRVKTSSSDNISQRKKDREENFVAKLFTQTLGPILCKTSIKITVVTVFLLYLIGSIYCTKFLQTSGDYSKLFPPSSSIAKCLQLDSEYFREYPHQINIVINRTLDYSDQNVQKDIEVILNTFESAPNMAGPLYTESWLRGYLSFIDNPISKFSLAGYNMTNPYDFVSGLKNVFLKINAANRFKNDILFNEEGDKIIASRFLLSSRNVKNTNDQKSLLENMFEIADKSKYPVYVYNFWFKFYETYFSVFWICIQTVCITAVVMIIMFIIVIPDVKLILGAALTIISIQLGIIGYMSVWDLRLDGTAMVILIASTGFSVDYMAHTSYAYISSEDIEPNEKLKNCLRSVGYPVFQSCMSTLLCVIGMYFGPSYQYVVFSKMLILMIIFAAFHSLFLLPVALNCLDILSIKLHKICERSNVSGK